MKNLKSVFQSLIIASTTAFSISVSQISYADEVAMPCCNDATCPTRQEGPPGEMGVTQIATFVGVSVPVGGGERVILGKFSGDPTYADWKKVLYRDRSVSREVRTALIDASRTKPRVSAWCVPNSAVGVTPKAEGFILTPGGENFRCEYGKIVLSEDDLKCDDPATGPYSIVDITRDDKKKRELEALRAQHADLERQRQKSARKIEQHDANIRRLEGQIFNDDLKQSFIEYDRNKRDKLEGNWGDDIEKDVKVIDFGWLGKDLVLPDSALSW